MIIYEIPRGTIQEELHNLEDFPANGFNEVYAAGARATLQWIVDRQVRPSEFLSRPVGDPS